MQVMITVGPLETDFFLRNNVSFRSSLYMLSLRRTYTYYYRERSLNCVTYVVCNGMAIILQASYACRGRLPALAVHSVFS